MDRPDIGLEDGLAGIARHAGDVSVRMAGRVRAVVALGAALDAARTARGGDSAALRAWVETPQRQGTVEYAWLVPAAIRLALRCSGVGLAERLRHRGDGLLPVQQHVMASVEALAGRGAR